MADTLQMAFKEWAVICEALGKGKQSLILRKGGIAEEKGLFTPDHSRFWLYPTFVHQQRDGIRSDAGVSLEEIEAMRPPESLIHLSLFCEVSGVFRVNHLDRLLELEDLHIWSRDTVEKRFFYREPGLYVLPVRVFRLPIVIEHAVKPEYEGCKTWVDLGEELSTEGAVPVIETRSYHDFLERLEGRINPRGMA